MSSHEERMEALLQELVQQVKGLAAGGMAELKGVKAELEATKEEVRALKAEQARAHQLDIMRYNQQARMHNAEMFGRPTTIMLPMNDNGQLPARGSNINAQDISGWQDAELDWWLNFYQLKPGSDSYDRVNAKRSTLLRHLRGFGLHE